MGVNVYPSRGDKLVGGVDLLAAGGDLKVWPDSDDVLAIDGDWDLGRVVTVFMFVRVCARARCVRAG